MSVVIPGKEDQCTHLPRSKVERDLVLVGSFSSHFLAVDDGALDVVGVPLKHVGFFDGFGLFGLRSDFEVVGGISGGRLDAAGEGGEELAGGGVVSGVRGVGGVGLGDERRKLLSVLGRILVRRVGVGVEGGHVRLRRGVGDVGSVRHEGGNVPGGVRVRFDDVVIVGVGVFFGLALQQAG